MAARRLLFGAVIVHGVHAVLWALESCWPTAPAARLSGLTVQFRQPIRIAAAASCEVVREESGALTLRVTSEARTVAEIECSHEPSPRRAGAIAWPRPVRSECRDMSFADASRAQGVLALTYDPEAMQGHFPRLAASLPAWQLALILAADRLLGMECPGRNSLYSAFALRFGAANAAPRALSYHVEAADPRFRSLHVAVHAPGLAGELSVSYRPTAVEQAPMKTVAQVVEPREFSGIRALVIGGSRGLGEVTAKLVAAGGGDVRLSYHVGAGDAARVVSDIRAAAGIANACAVDVLQPNTIRDALGDGWTPTHLFYFPTPFISLNETTAFSPVLFETYCRYYVSGFVETLRQVREASAPGLAVLYPSTTALDEVIPKAMEYAAAKAAGETACAHLRKLYGDLRVHVRRLPRMLTDRTATVLPVESQDPVAVMLAEIRRLVRGGAGPGPKSR